MHGAIKFRCTKNPFLQYYNGHHTEFNLFLLLSRADGPSDGGMTLTYDTTTLTSSGQEISYISGSLLVVTCNADCNEVCSYLWHKSSDTSSTLSSTANLTLPNLQLRDEGNYICTAINTRGSSTFSFSLLVTGVCVCVCVCV